MKKSTFLFLLFTATIILGCNTESIEDNTLTNQEPIFSVTENTINFQLRSTSSCATADLMAGQDMKAGTVTAEIENDNLVITYSTDTGWTIDLTHLSVGDCSLQTIPQTGSGNPKVGKFEHTEPHEVTTNSVVYKISLDYLNLGSTFCFAAHAEVTSSTGGETAWARNQPTEPDQDPQEYIKNFDGNSWATYVEVSTCNTDTTGYK